MIEPQIPANESERLSDLISHSILDTLSDDDFDNLTAIAAEICNTPIALVSLIDSERQWFKSNHGLAARETPRNVAFCAHAINEPQKTFIVNDARKDIRFSDNPLVVDDPHVIFYAGVPLISEKGLPLGTLCVIDNEPKKLSKSQLNSLKALSRQVMNLMKLRKAENDLKKSLEKITEQNKSLDHFATMAAHDLKSPLSNIGSMAMLYNHEYSWKLGTEEQAIINQIISSSHQLTTMVDGLLEHSRSLQSLIDLKVNFKMDSFLAEVMALYQNGTDNVNLAIKNNLTDVFANKAALHQILINLVGNAVKYNDKDLVEIEIGASEDAFAYRFFVKDNGPGIPQNMCEKIFQIFEVGAVKDRYGSVGHGLGLAAVKKLVTQLDGEVMVESAIGEGSTFIFHISK